MPIVKYNQENNCVAVGTNTGLSIYTLDPIELRYRDSSEGIGVIEMLYCTSLVALVGSGHTPGSSPRKVKLLNLQSKEMICELNFASAVLEVKLSKQRMIICLADQVHIYDLNTIKCLQILSSTSTAGGLIAFAPEPSCYLAFPTVVTASNPGTSNAAPSTITGGVMVYDTISLRPITQINAHRNNIVAIEFNAEGTMLATASTTGTMIRVFSLPTGAHTHSFRRGATAVTISSLSFDASSELLLAGSRSGNGTIHIFSLSLAAAGISSAGSQTGPGGNNNSNSGGTDLTTAAANVVNTVTSTAYVALTNVTLWSKAVAEGMGVLPEPVSEFANSIRAYCTIRLPETSTPDGRSTNVLSYTAAFIQGTAAGGDTTDSTGTAEVTSRSLSADGSALTSNQPQARKIAVVTEDCHLYRYVIPPVIIPIVTSDSASASAESDRASCSSADRSSETAGVGSTAVGVLEDEALLS